MGLFFGWPEGSGTLRFLLSRGMGLAGLHAYAFDLGELRALGAVSGFGGFLDGFHFFRQAVLPMIPAEMRLWIGNAPAGVIFSGGFRKRRGRLRGNIAQR